jgi:hypothetical protein
MTEAVVARTSSSLRPWQVLIVERRYWYIHASFKTRSSAFKRARELVPGKFPKVLNTADEVTREIEIPFILLEKKKGSRPFILE